MTGRRFLSIIAACAFATVCATNSTVRCADDPSGIAFFESRIRSVLVENCYECHSAQAHANKKLRGGLYLDSKDGLLKGGDTGPAIVPNKPKESLLLKTLHQSGDTKMPPKGKLPASILADFESWIARGAPDPRIAATAKQTGLSLEEGRKFWSYVPLKKPTVPQVADVTNEIDAFIAAKQLEKGLKFAPEASRIDLVRRLYFDLIGMPPTPAEIDAFVNDKATDAYEKLVDRLLASPHFGERWGRHYLDLVRYAESITLRGTIMKEAWRYRDYVIDSFNQDVPFDRFVREQIAGDLLPFDSLDQRRRQLIATSFLSLGNTNLEEQDKKQLDFDVVDEQLDVLSKAFLAQTVTCARCHDHKFDPIPTKDYYSLAGILRNTKTLEHSNVSKWLEMSLPAPPDREEQFKKHEAQVAALQKQIQTLKANVAKGKKPADPTKPTIRAVADLPGIVVDDVQAKKVGTWKESTHSGYYIGAGYIHDEGKDKGEKSLTFDPDIPHTGKYEVRFAYEPGTNRSTKVPVTVFSADGEKTLYIDETKPPEIEGQFHSLGQYKFEKDGQSFVIVNNEGTTGVVVADAVLFIPVEQLAEIKPAPKSPASKDAPQSEADQLKAMEAKLKRLQADHAGREMFMTIQEESKIEDQKVRIRGNVHNQGELAPRGFLRVAMTGPSPKMPSDQSGRVQLADWVVSRDNPLTPRVYANRTWHWLFGTGLVRTTDNFGTTGEKPSHPELLDFLSSRFIDDGWSTKKLVRLVVLSRTYRQAVLADPKAVGADPDNRLISHQNRRRLEAECIRDAILSVSGQIKLEPGGRTFADVGADYGYKHTDLRRSIYSPLFRNSVPELFEVFDGADPSVCTGNRNVSTVAPQALFLLNNPFVQAQAKSTAQRLLENKNLDDASRIQGAFRLTLGRLPSDGERQLAERFLSEASQDPKSKLDHWAQFVQTLFASLDFRYIN